MASTKGRTKNAAVDATARAPLNREAIVAGAVAIADRDGVSKLTMRNLAAELGYEVMSLYNHVANKGELFELMLEAVAAEIEVTVDGVDPLGAVRDMALSYRAALVNHPWSSDLWLRHRPGPHRIQQMEDLLRILDETGLPPDLAHHGFHAVNNHVLGYTIQERGIATNVANAGDPEQQAADFMAGLSTDQHPRMIAHVRHHMDGHATSSFELVLDLILDGLVRSAEERTGSGEPGS